MDATISTGELARRVGVLEPVIQRLVRCGLVSAPQILGGRRRWTVAEVEIVRQVVRDRGLVGANAAADPTEVSTARRPRGAPIVRTFA